MPLNTLRLNHQPSSHPNDRIVFIKPIPRPSSQKDDYDRAELILKAIAAQCLPIMKEHYLSVTTLEEYEHNPEFIGRNFNNGEIIQLVLQSKSGAWIPLSAVQMVMMHELAHNTHMNHGKGFWQARNLYANEMRRLWSKNYTGEGLWGRGHTLSALEAAFGGNVVASEEVANLPLCGGTFRSRRKKRKLAEVSADLTWKEKRDKRVEKKFGKSGNALGADEDRRMLLHMNSKAKGGVATAPRVAQSKRGRELRAAAALARFGTNKKEVEEIDAMKGEVNSESETEGEYEEVDTAVEDATDRHGKKLLDGNGQSVVRVCEDEDLDDDNVKNEMAELANLTAVPRFTATDADNSDATPSPENADHLAVPILSPKSIKDETATRKEEEQPKRNVTIATPGSIESQETPDPTPKITSLVPQSLANAGSEVPCVMCSMSNESLRLTCLACSHVLDARKDPRHWKCTSDVCVGSSYINAGDCGRCGICGEQKPAEQKTQPVQRIQGDRQFATGSGHIAYL